MEVRPRNPSDDEEWLRMRRALWPQLPPETHRDEMAAWVARDDSAVLVAPRPEGTGLAGFAEVGERSVADGCDTSPVGYLEGWYVDPDVRRRGVGAALVHAAWAWARQRGYREFASDAELDNGDSQRAHRALGFTELGRSVLYRKVLTLLVLGVAAGQPASAQRRGWMFGPFEKPARVNPVITPDPASTFRSPVNDSLVRWEEYATFNPAAVVRGGKVFLLYRAEDASGEMRIGHHTSRLGLAESSDGLRFTRRPAPVLYPDRDAQATYEWPGGVEDPRIVETEDGTYVLTYTQWNRDVPRLAVATSPDLVHWTKRGPAFARSAGGRYLNVESKSGAIVSRVDGERVIATRINGTYWMYYNVPDILIATSDNLVDWTPLVDADGRLVKVLSPRPGYFDSWLVEAGPPALVTEHGILVLYNAGNDSTHGDPALPHHVYAGGQALFDRRNPVKLIARAGEPFIRPTEAYERRGQYAQGTTFVQGLVPFRGRWFLYYGTADSRVGVAVWNPNR